MTKNFSASSMVPPAEGGFQESVQRCVHLEWLFGLNRDFKGVVHNISNGSRRRVCYAVSNTLVFFDLDTREQQLLEGHRNLITSTECSADCAIIVSADTGSGSALILWDAASGLPIKLLHTEEWGGVAACALSSDGTWLATLSVKGTDSPQFLSLWDCTAEGAAGQRPILRGEVRARDAQTLVRFHPDDPFLLVTNGARRVIFWGWEEGRFKYYSPAIVPRELRQPVGRLTQSAFLPGTSLAASGTVDGDVILWDSVRNAKPARATDKTLMKIVQIHKGAITFLSVVAGYIVTAGAAGDIRFLDSQLKIVAWFEELNAGPIVSVSFGPAALSSGASCAATATAGGASTLLGDFVPPDFVASTGKAMVVYVRGNSFTTGTPQEQRGTLLVQGQERSIMCLAAHPSAPRLVLGGDSGAINCWDYETHRTLCISFFKARQLRSLAFNRSGCLLAAGFADGGLKILDGSTLEELQSFSEGGTCCVSRIVFDNNDTCIVTADAEGHIALYMFTHRALDKRKPLEWVYIGRHLAHRSPISGLLFADPRMAVPGSPLTAGARAPRLLSLGEDRRLVEFDVSNTTLNVLCAHKITQTASPTAMLWTKDQGILEAVCVPHPPSRLAAGLQDGFLIIADDQYKISIINAGDADRWVIKTIQGPTFSSPITRLLLPPPPSAGGGLADTPRCLIYATQERVLGAIGLPLDGNPYRMVGRIAHPCEIADVCLTADGTLLFSAGGRDCAVAQWRLDAGPLHAAPSDARPADVPATTLGCFLDAIDGGAEGAFVRQIVDYFYYAQIRAQGEETTKKRKILGTIPLSQAANLMRALGFYPTNKEIESMNMEVRTAHAGVRSIRTSADSAGGNRTGSGGTGGEGVGKGAAPQQASAGDGENGVDTADVNIDFEELVRLYVNHRPVYGISRSMIDSAFLALGADESTGLLDKEILLRALECKGEPMTHEEIDACLKSLLGQDVDASMLETQLTSKVFAENLLGFENCDEDEERGEQMERQGS